MGWQPEIDEVAAPMRRAGLRSFGFRP